MNFDKVIESWFISKRSSLSESTRANVSFYLNNYFIPMLGNIPCTFFSRETVLDFMKKLEQGDTKSGKKLSPGTTTTVMGFFRQIILYGFRNGYIEPFFLDFQENNKKAHPVKKVMSNDELPVFVTACLENLNNYTYGYLLSLVGALRISELCALRWEDFDFIANRVTISRNIQRVQSDKGTTTELVIRSPGRKNFSRTVTISNYVLSLATQINPDGQKGFVLTNSEKVIEPRVLRRKFDAFCKQHGLSHFTFNSMRNSFCDFCLSRGMDIYVVYSVMGNVLPERYRISNRTLTSDDISDCLHLFDELTRDVKGIKQ